MSVKVHEALRICRVCGLGAKTEESLELFRKSKRLPHGRETICKACYRITQRVPVKPYLRRCRFCGFEVHLPDELELFRKRIRGKYGRDNWCRECYNKAHRSGGPYYLKALEYKIAQGKTESGLRMKRVRELSRYHISLEGKTCEICGTSENLHRHHLDYDDHLNVEILCATCHRRVHQ